MPTYLSSNVLLRITNNKTVLGSVILILGLDDQGTTLLVVSLTTTTTSELHLEALKVHIVLNNFDKTHFDCAVWATGEIIWKRIGRMRKILGM